LKDLPRKIRIVQIYYFKISYLSCFISAKFSESFRSMGS